MRGLIWARWASIPSSPLLINDNANTVSFCSPTYLRCGSTEINMTTVVVTRERGNKFFAGIRCWAYKRKPTGTPGAYELIDQETGEKVIVWGGLDNDSLDSPIPSKHALSWSPTSPSSRGVDPAANDASSDNVNSKTNISSTSFGKLKSQHVRALIKRSAQLKKENVDDSKKMHYESVFSDKSGSSVSDDEASITIKNASLPNYKGNKSRAMQQLQKMNCNSEGKEMVEDEESSLVHIYGTEHNLDGHHASGRTREVSSAVLEPNVSAPSAVSSFQGWRNSSSFQKPTMDSIKISKQYKKNLKDDGFFSKKSFKALGCSDEMIESLKSQLFVRSSRIQALAFDPITRGKSCIIADQSGSGKTLAYLVPVIERLRHEELHGLGKSLSRSPRVLILVPTAELASQVLRNCRSISKYGVPFRSMVVTGGFRQKTQLDNLQQELDFLIATPGRFIYLLKEGFLQLSNLTCAVLDEVDVLFGDEDFEQALQSLISSAPVALQYVFVTATLPVVIYNKLVEVFPDCEVIMGPGIHRTSCGLEEILVDCSGDDEQEKGPDTAFLNKKTALLQLVEEFPISKTIVFCNKIETCRKVENALNRYDRKGVKLRVLPFHAALTQESRLANMKEFLGSQSQDLLFLVSTDRASRGIDFTNVDHVILFDFPRDPSEYVRRVGRTARGAGGKGKAFVFVVGKQVSLARKIMERNIRGHPLHDIPASHELMSSAL